MGILPQLQAPDLSSDPRNEPGSEIKAASPSTFERDRRDEPQHGYHKSPVDADECENAPRPQECAGATLAPARFRRFSERGAYRNVGAIRNQPCSFNP